MGLDKTSIDARPSTVKKNIFVSGYFTTGNVTGKGNVKFIQILI